MWSGRRAIEKVVGQEVHSCQERERKKKEKVKINQQSPVPVRTRTWPGDPPRPPEITCLQPKSSSWLWDAQLTNENCSPTTHFTRRRERHWHHPSVLRSFGRDKMIAPSMPPPQALPAPAEYKQTRVGQISRGRQTGRRDRHHERMTRRTTGDPKVKTESEGEGRRASNPAAA